MPTRKKIEQVDLLTEKFIRCTIAISTDYTGIGVNSANDLRKKLRENEIEFRVIKNTLTYLAADAAQKPEVKNIVKGPTAFVFGYGDPTETAKSLTEYIRIARSPLKILGAILDNRRLDPNQVSELSNLPSRDELIAQLLGSLQSPIASLIGQLGSPIQKLSTVLAGPLASVVIGLQQRADSLRVQE